MLSSKVVVHPLAPEERLIHHQVALLAVQLGNAAGADVLSVGVVVRVGIM